MKNFMLKIKRSIKEGYSDFRNFGLKVAFAKIRLICADESLKSIKYRNKILCKYIEKNFDYLLKKYNDYKIESTKAEDTIWVFWWTGEESMPLAIKLCHQSKLNNSNGCKVVLLTEENIKDYVSFPDFVWTQFEEGKLRIQHFADMIRVQLVKKYGGVWLDASLYCTEPIDEKIFDLEIFSLKEDIDERFVSLSRWTTFAIGGYKDNVLCAFLNEFFIDYCKTGKPFIDYFMFDCAIAVAYDNITSVKEKIDILEKTDDIYWLTSHIKDEFDITDMKNIKMSPFQKIAWKSIKEDDISEKSLYKQLMTKEFCNEKS